MPPTLALRAVRKSFRGRACLDGLDLEVAPGSVFGFLGPNGAGKTTTIRIVLGLLRADAGEVRVLGHDPAIEGTRVREDIGALLDHDGHYDRLTAQANLVFHAEVRGLARDVYQPRIRELLMGCGLWDRRGDRVATFSKGMRQKLAVARALLHRPKLVLLDEPFTGLDPAAAVELRDAIRKLARDEGASVLLTTHDLHHVEKLCDRVAVLESGRAAASGAPSDLRAGGDEVFVAGEGLSSALLEEMAGEGMIASFRMDASGALVRCDPAQKKAIGVELVRRGVRLEELTPKRASLEDAFLKIVSPTE